MATKIRLQRRGRKAYPFYHIVIADSRAPRDGKFIEKIGTYNPNTDPIALDVNMERALYWLGVGAQPTDTARNLLSEKGVMLKKHLLGGVTKGAFSEEEAEKKFNAWLSGKDKEAAVILTKQEEKAKADAKAKLDAEKTANKSKAEEVAQKQAQTNVEAAEAEVIETVEEVGETPVDETAPEVEATKVEVTETVKEVAETPTASAPEVEAEAPANEEEKTAE